MVRVGFGHGRATLCPHTCRLRAQEAELGAEGLAVARHPVPVPRGGLQVGQRGRVQQRRGVIERRGAAPEAVAAGVDLVVRLRASRRRSGGRLCAAVSPPARSAPAALRSCACACGRAGARAPAGPVRTSSGWRGARSAPACIWQVAERTPAQRSWRGMLALKPERSLATQPAARCPVQSEPPCACMLPCVARGGLPGRPERGRAAVGACRGGTRAARLGGAVRLLVEPSGPLPEPHHAGRVGSVQRGQLPAPRLHV